MRVCIRYLAAATAAVINLECAAVLLKNVKKQKWNERWERVRECEGREREWERDREKNKYKSSAQARKAIVVRWCPRRYYYNTNEGRHMCAGQRVNVRVTRAAVAVGVRQGILVGVWLLLQLKHNNNNNNILFLSSCFSMRSLSIWKPQCRRRRRR